MDTFYLGTHNTSWLERLDVPLFISYTRLKPLKKAYVPATTWCLDSGGFSELSKHGTWTLDAATYAKDAQRYMSWGGLQWCAVQDWMCEPQMLKKTGLSILEHQTRTIASLRQLRDLAPDIPWLPVLQGWSFDDYLRHADAYEAAGFSLASESYVGVGSICRRQGTKDVLRVLERLHSRGLRLHAFGFKKTGLAKAANWLASSDSLAWSYTARRTPVLLEGCEGHINCANCPKYALQWREDLLKSLPDDEYTMHSMLLL